MQQNSSNQNICKINIQSGLFYWLVGEYFHRILIKNGAHKPLKALKNGFPIREVILRYLSFLLQSPTGIIGRIVLPVYSCKIWIREEVVI